MRQYFQYAAILIISAMVYSCAASGNCSSAGKYKIDFSTGGGFTGIVNGTTIYCDGRVMFWERYPNSAAQIKDSLTLQEDRLKHFNLLVQSPDVFTYSHSYSGNYTATLTISKDSVSNTISYNPSEEPADFPQAIKEIISEIKIIKK